MRSKFFWLILLSLLILAGIISCISSDTAAHPGTVTPVPILPEPDENEYDYEPEPEELLPPEPGELDVQTENVIFASRYAGFLTWGYFHHSTISEPVAFAESRVTNVVTGRAVELADILDIDEIDGALTLLSDALLEYAPESMPYLHLIDETWLEYVVMDTDGLRVLLKPDIAPWELGFVTILLLYQDLGRVFLLYDEYTQYEPARRPMVALTFDDGPHAIYTPAILDVLEEYNASATFFVLGNRVHNHADIIRRSVDMGSEVLGHSWSHPDMTRLGTNGITDQITRTSQAIEEVLGWPTVPLFRAPYGLANSRVINTARDMGYSLVHWSVDPQDWAHENRCPYIITNLVMDRVTDGAIILLHDVHTTTMEAARILIPRLIEEGFDLVTASELIDYFYGVIEPGARYVGFRNRLNGW